MNAVSNDPLAVLHAMLRPTRVRLPTCRARADAYLADERRSDERRVRALAECRTRIEQARASVFAAGDGVVKADMTALEREWRTLARDERSVAERTLSLWKRIAPRRRADQLPWVSSNELATDAEIAVALASDPDGVERAEACALRLCSALAISGSTATDHAPHAPPSVTVTWEVARMPRIMRAGALLEESVRALTDAVASIYGGEALLARARGRAQAVLDAASRSPLPAAAGGLAEDLAFVAHADFLWRTRAAESQSASAESPTAALLDLWRTGYVLSDVGGQRVTLGAVVAEA